MACTGNEPYTVGAAGPWQEGYGKQNLLGIRLAADEINAAGGIRGHQFRVIERDDGAGPGAARVAEEFAHNRAVSAVIGHVNSGGMLAAARVYNEARLTALGTSPTLPDLSAMSPWLFRVISSDSINAIALANFASSAVSTGGREPTAAVIYENNNYGRGLADSFIRSFRGRILSSDPINADLSSAEPYITFLRIRQPEIVFVAGRVRSGTMILSEAKRQNFKPIFIGGDGWQGIALNPAVAEGIYIGMSFTAEDPSPAARKFVTSFSSRFHMAPDAHAALAYDATYVIAQALAARGADRRAIRDYLAGLSAETAYRGLTGPVWFGASGDPVGIRFRVFRVHDGLLTVADTQ